MNVDQLIMNLRAPDQRGSGRIRDLGADNIDRLTALDANAHTVRAFDEGIIPGLLQTPPYSEAVIRAAHPYMPAMEVRRRMLLKHARTRAFLARTLGEGEPLRYAWFIMGEAPIVRQFGALGGHEHAAQLRHLLMLSAHEKIMIQVLPADIVPAGLAHHFLLYGWDQNSETTGPRRVGYVETIMGAHYSTRLDDVARLHSSFSDIGKDAMPPESSHRFIREALASWRRSRNTSPEPTEESDSSSLPSREEETTASESPERPRAPWRTEP